MKETPKKILLGIALVAVNLLECYLAYWMLTRTVPPHLTGACLHLLLVAAFIFLLLREPEEHQNPKKNIIYVALILSLCLPVYGMVGISILLLITKPVKKSIDEYLGKDDLFLPSKHKMFLKDPDRKPWLVERDELDVTAFRDVFKSNDRELEEIVIAKLTRTVTRQSVDILKEVLTTSTSDTKILAATALTEIEGKIINAIGELQTRVEENPHDLEAVLELARTYDLYCYLGVLDPSTVSMYQNMSIDHYEQYFNISPAASPEVTMEYGRLLHNAGRDSAAILALDRAAELAPENASPKIWLAEVYFKSGNYAMVTKTCDEIMAFKSLPDRSREVASLWSTIEGRPPDEGSPIAVADGEAVSIESTDETVRENAD